jgi:hypothetical protein
MRPWGVRYNGEARHHRLSVDFPSRLTRALVLAPLAGDREQGLALH